MKFTFGTELELANIDRSKGLPNRVLGFSKTEYDLVGTKEYAGLPIDPTGKAHTINGELNFIPTDTIEEQVEIFKDSLEYYGNGDINWRYDLHLHIAIDGVSESDKLDLYKTMLTYFYNNTRDWVSLCYNASRHPDMLDGDYAFYKVNAKYMPEWRYNNIMNSNTLDEFIIQHSTDTTGKYNPRFGTRYPFNMISIKKHGTVESRCNWPTLDPDRYLQQFKLYEAVMKDAVSSNPKGVKAIVQEMAELGITPNKETVDTYDHYIQCSYRYCNYNVCKPKDMMERYNRFKDLYAKNPENYKVNGWWNNEELMK